MTMFRVPDALGGGEHDGSLTTFAGRRYWAFGTPETGRFYVEEAVLTEVKPLLPPEPPVGTVVSARLVDEDKAWTFERIADHAWAHVKGEWFAAGDDTGGFRWEALCHHGTPVRLVPAPEPVELPWGHRDREHCSVDVNESPRTWAACRVSADDSVDLTPEVAETMARALWTAAARHREATS